MKEEELNFKNKSEIRVKSLRFVQGYKSYPKLYISYKGNVKESTHCFLTNGGLYEETVTALNGADAEFKAFGFSENVKVEFDIFRKTAKVEFLFNRGIFYNFTFNSEFGCPVFSSVSQTMDRVTQREMGNNNYFIISPKSGR